MAIKKTDVKTDAKSTKFIPLVERPLFNLLDEPWIKVSAVTSTGKANVKSLNLCEVFEKAHQIRGLAGELAGQDLAILRLLLSILHIIYTRTPEYSKARSTGETEEAQAIWESLYKAGQFDAERIIAYLKQYQDRFYLVHPERPFYQIAGLLSDVPEARNTYGIRKLIGDLSESNNKSPLFSYRNGMQELAFDEAARWLLYLNAFDDCSNKPVYVKGVSAGLGWLGSIGNVYLEGTSLFDTLMLNFVLYNVDQSNPFWEDAEAPWELAVPRSAERVELAHAPKGQIELLTLQSRRIWLFPTDTGITGFTEISGDFIPDGDVMVEQMTLLSCVKETATTAAYFQPKRHSSATQFWRGFASLITKSNKSLTPGVLRWLAELQYNWIVDPRDVTVCAVRVDYKDMNGAVGDVWSDSFSINTGLFVKSDCALEWLDRIAADLSIIEKMVDSLGKFALDVAMAGGFHPNKNNPKPTLAKKEPSKDKAYAILDTYFRHWIASIAPDTADIAEKSKELILVAKDIVLSVGLEIYNQAGDRAFSGLVQKTGKDGDANILNSIQAYSKFVSGVNSIVKKGGYKE